MSRFRTYGFTLIELLVTISVLAVLLAIALPSFQSTIRSNRVATATNELIGAFSLARSEAVKNGRGAAVCASTAGTACDGAWGQGWIVWGDKNGNGALDGGEPVLRYTQAKQGMTFAFSGAAGPIAFDPRGRRVAAGSQVLTLRPDKCGSSPLQRKLTISVTGLPKVEKEGCPS